VYRSVELTTLVSLRLGFDLDGVFADLGGRLTEYSSSSPGARDADGPLDTTHLRGASAETWRRVAAIENFWESLDEIEPGSVQQLASLARERRWDVIFLTSRPDTKGDSVQVQSQRWLDNKGYSLPSVFVTKGSRGRIAASLALDLVVDDNPGNCLDVATESDARAILVWRGAAEVAPASARKLGVGAVPTMVECLSVLDQADRAARSEGGFLASFRRLLGLADSY
jgi:hypothetical protein